MRSLNDDVPFEACNDIDWRGCAMTQAVSGRSFTAEARVQSQGSPCWTLLVRLSSVTIIPSMLHTHSFTAHRRYRRSYNLHRQSHYMNALKMMRGYEIQLPV